MRVEPHDAVDADVLPWLTIFATSTRSFAGAASVGVTVQIRIAQGKAGIAAGDVAAAVRRIARAEHTCAVSLADFAVALECIFRVESAVADVASVV